MEESNSESVHTCKSCHGKRSEVKPVSLKSDTSTEGQLGQQRKVRGPERKNNEATHSRPKKAQKREKNNKSGGRLFRLSLDTFLGVIKCVT